MAKLNLTFYGVEGTVGKKGESIANVYLSMSTGSKSIKEAKCYYNVSYTGTEITEIGNKTSTLEAEIEHLKTVNRKLMQRNLDLSKKESASKFLG